MQISVAKNKATPAEALVIISSVMLTSFIIAALFFARDILIPLALAALLTFLLAPFVTRLERRIGRIAAVLVVVAFIFAGAATAGWILTRQLIDLATKLPGYKGNIVAKMRSFQVPQGGAFSAFSKTLDDLKKELPGSDSADTPSMAQKAGEPAFAVVTPSGLSPVPTPVQLVETSRAGPLDLIQSMLAPLIGPAGTAALVLLLVICMLLQREDLRSRVIRLAGTGRISATTRAMDDAGKRVSRYLLMQLVVNVSYGIPVAVGLYFIGVPNAVLWGGFAIILRFIPYIGPWVAAAIPLMLSLAVSPDWTMPLLTLGLFVFLELLSNNVMEPWLYGTSTGVSTIALIVAAVFWTWLWGPAGLVLATPMTVCLVVMGRHVPRLAFLSVLLSDDDALTPAEDLYHRLLTPGGRDEIELVESYLKSNGLSALFDSVFVPVVTSAEADALQGKLTAEQLSVVKQGVSDLMTDIETLPARAKGLSGQSIEIDGETPPLTVPCRVACFPARAQRDELTGSMLVTLLKQNGFEASCESATLVAGEMIGTLEKNEADVVCISAVAPSTVMHARYLCLKLRAQFPRLRIIVGLWGETEDMAEGVKRLRDSGADEVVSTLAEAVIQVARLAPKAEQPMLATPILEHDVNRVMALPARG